jgi:hypothetical protein
MLSDCGGNSHEAGCESRMTGCVFKKKRKRSISWCYVFFGGWDATGKRVQISKAGYPTKDAASTAVRLAIDEYEAKTGRITRELGQKGRRVWSYSFDGVCQSGFETAARKAVSASVRWSCESSFSARASRMTIQSLCFEEMQVKSWRIMGATSDDCRCPRLFLEGSDKTGRRERRALCVRTTVPGLNPSFIRCQVSTSATR